MAVGIENHTNFGCAASLVTDRLESQIGDGIGGSFYRRKCVNCHPKFSSQMCCRHSYCLKIEYFRRF
jgi:hypothetical protein